MLPGILEEPEDMEGIEEEHITMFSPPMEKGVEGFVAMPSRYDENAEVTRVLKEGIFGNDGRADSGVDPLVRDEGITFVSGRVRGDIAEGGMTDQGAKKYGRANRPIGWKGKEKKKTSEGEQLASSANAAQNFGLPAQAGLDNDKAAFGSQAYMKQMQQETPDQFIPRGSNLLVETLHEPGAATYSWRLSGFPAGKTRIVVKIEVKDPNAVSGWIDRQYCLKIARAKKAKKAFGSTTAAQGLMHNIDLSRLNHALAVMPPVKKRELGAVITLQAIWRARMGRKMFNAVALKKKREVSAIKIQVTTSIVPSDYEKYSSNPSHSATLSLFRTFPPSPYQCLRLLVMKH